jgi:hypothetical protein
MRKLAQWFDSIETGKPFISCKICEKNLPKAGDSWVINKHYHRKECVMEYAICDHCRDQVAGSFSEASKTAIRDFLETQIDWEQRILEWSKLDQPTKRMDHCVACTMPREWTQEFTISAQFRSDGSLIEGALPLLLCGHCVSQITESLSPESRETWNRFIATYFEGPDSQDYHPGIF